MKYRLKLAISLSLGMLLVSHAQAQETTKTTLPQDQCQATYSTSDQTLTIPCVAVDMQDKELNYQVILKQTDSSASNFSLLTATPTESATDESKCVAAYSIDTGRLDIPCAGLLSIPHETSKSLALYAATPAQPNVFSLADPPINTRRALNYPSKNKIILIDGLDLDRTKGCLLYQISENKTIQQLTGFTDQDIQSFVAFFSENYSMYCESSDMTTSYMDIDFRDRLKNNGISDSDIYSFKWSRNAIEHGLDLQKKFRKWFVNNICELSYPSNDIKDCGEVSVSFIAHSWGTVIMTDFINSLPEVGNTKIRINLVVSLGSPVSGTTTGDSPIKFWEYALNKVKQSGGHWINLVNYKDPIAWNIETPNILTLKGFVINIEPSTKTKSTKSLLGNEIYSQIPVTYSSMSLKNANSANAIKDLLSAYDYYTSGSTGFDISEHDPINYYPDYISKMVALTIKNLTKPTDIDGVGSLVNRSENPNLNPKFLCDLHDSGCLEDVADMKPHNKPSTVVFQWNYKPEICEYIDIYTDSSEAREEVIVRFKQWDSSNIAEAFYGRLPLRIKATGYDWTVLSVTSTKLLSKPASIFAACSWVSDMYNHYEHYPLPPKPVLLDGGYQWVGNGSLIYKSMNDIGGKRDLVKITGDNSLAYFQWSPSKGCERIIIEANSDAPLNEAISYKKWNGVNWFDTGCNKSTSCIFPSRSFVDYPDGFTSGFYLLKIKADAVNPADIMASCQSARN